MKTLRFLGVSVALCALAFGPACTKDKGGKKNEETVSRPTEDKKKALNLVAPAFFKKIPADSPFVYASYEPWDEAFLGKLGDMFSPLMDMAMAEAEKDNDPEAKEFFREHGDLFTIAGLKKIGIDATPRMAAYMVGVSLVFRVELEDGDALNAFVDEMIKKYSDEPVEAKTLGSVRYWEAPPDELAFVVGIDKSELIMAVMPPAQKASLLPTILGDQMPAKSIVDTGALKAVVAEYGGAKGAGYLDSHALIQLFTAPGKGLEGTEADLSSLSSVCKTELASLADLMPRMVFGYDALDQTEISMFYGVELRKDVAKRLSEVVKPVPGYGQLVANPGVMSFGMGFNVASLMSWANEISSAVKASPYRCEEFEELNEVLSSASEATGMAPPMLGDLGGFVMSLDEFDILNPTSASGVIAVASKEPGALLALLGNFVPAFRGLKLEAGAKPTKVELAELGIPLEIHVARGKSMLGFSAGANSASRLKALVAEKPTKDGPFFSMIYDYSMFTSIFEKTMSDEDPEEAQAVMKLLGAFGLLTFEARVRPKGIQARYSFKMR
jgi:hypothetical protein